MRDETTTSPTALTHDAAPAMEREAVEDAADAGTSSTTAYTREQLAKLAFAICYSSNLCAPQNIASVIKEVDTCSGDCDYLGSSVCGRLERGEFCPFSLAEDLRQISAALYGPRDPSHYVGSVFGPDKLTALSSPAVPAPMAQATGGVEDDEADEAHAIGLEEGYENAVRDIDLATGGDGEFKGSSAGTVDVPVMRQRIIDRFAALSRPQPQAVPDGWQLVPVEPTQAMANAGYREWNRTRASSTELLYRAMLAAAPSAPRSEAVGVETFQKRVDDWLLACFGETIARDRIERNHRFIEEALELVQANGCTQDEAHQLVDYVYGRPIGEVHQEVGGVMNTLAALCLASGIDLNDAAETELARVWTKVEAIRAKQAAKPKHSPLPQAAALHQPEPVSGNAASDPICRQCASGEPGIPEKCTCKVIRQPEPVSGWRPMDSAPRDGTRVDLWVKPHDALANGNPGRIADAWFEQGEWKRSIDGRDHFVSSCGVAVGWMPLPATPAQGDGQ